MGVRRSISSRLSVYGDAIVADLRDKMPGKAITEKDLEKRLDNRIRKALASAANRP